MMIRLLDVGTMAVDGPIEPRFFTGGGGDEGATAAAAATAAGVDVSAAGSAQSCACG
jgi:hypothetical protein